MSPVPVGVEKNPDKLKLLQLNLNHCEAAQDLLMQTVRDLSVDVAILSEPYKTRTHDQWVEDATGAFFQGCLPYGVVVLGALI